MKMVRLNKVKKKGRFVFPHNIEIQLGTHGVFWVSVPYSEDRIRVRKLNAEDEFLVEYSKENTFIENRKARKWKRFSGEVSVIVE